jgi:hypothetical protein
MLQVLLNLGKLVAYWPVVQKVLEAITAFLAGETVPVVITWEKYKLEVTVKLTHTDEATVQTTFKKFSV